MSLSTGHIAGFASDSLREQYVPPMLQAKKIGAWCLTEPSSGSDVSKSRVMRQIFKQSQRLKNMPDRKFLGRAWPDEMQ